MERTTYFLLAISRIEMNSANLRFKKPIVDRKYIELMGYILITTKSFKRPICDIRSMD